MAPREEMKILMLGKTGVGKSTVANTISGKNVFKIGHTGISETSEFQSVTIQSQKRKYFTFIDTPGFFIPRPDVRKLMAETAKFITECASGIHAFLIVIKVEPFTEQQREEISTIYRLFSEEAFKYATVLFTHGDQLDERQTIEEYFIDCPCVLDLMKKCKGRCHVVDNKYWEKNKKNYRSNKFQLKKLLETIHGTMKTNKGRCYTNEMHEHVEELRQKEEGNIRPSPGNKTEKEIREAKERVSRKFLISLRGFTPLTLVGTFLGGMEFEIDAQLELLSLVGGEAGGGEVLQGGAVGGVRG